MKVVSETSLHTCLTSSFNPTMLAPKINPQRQWAHCRQKSIFVFSGWGMLPCQGMYISEVQNNNQTNVAYTQLVESWAKSLWISPVLTIDKDGPGCWEIQNTGQTRSSPTSETPQAISWVLGYHKRNWGRSGTWQPLGTYLGGVQGGSTWATVILFWMW